MNSHTDALIDPMNIVRELAGLPHRGATTANERQAADMLQRQLERLGASVERQYFRTAKTYITEVWWLVGGLVIGLLLIPYLSWIALSLAILAVGMSLFYFDWRHTPVSKLPPQFESANVIGRLTPASAAAESSSTKSRKKLILMAHYDSAPVSLLYLPSMVKNFRQSLLISLTLMVLACITALVETMGYGKPFITWLRWGFILYFLGQGIMSTVDFLRYGFTNGAADNATGTAAAVATAERLWRDPLPGWEVEVVLTGAEEAGMVGASKYYQAYQKELAAQETYVLNFDNIGSGNLKVITETGSITNVHYDNRLVRAALEAAAADPRFQNITEGAWHTGDFDSIWFNRAGIPGLTLSAQDAEGLIPHLHRPGDTLENVNPELPGQAVLFAEAVVRRLARSLPA